MAEKISMLRDNWYPTRLQRLKILISGKEWVNMMHISKTAGTAVKAILKEQHYTRKHALILHGHRWNLQMLRTREKVVFFMRDPLSRFVSGFYSRQRQGMPRYFNAWSVEEAKSFSIFQTPTQLAEALSADDDELRAQAIHAMHSIGHVRDHYSRWLISPDYLKSKIDDILFIGFQENLAEDFIKLKKILGLPSSLVLPNEEEKSNRTPDHFDKSLSDVARENLVEWYKDNYTFYHLSQEIYQQQFRGTD